MTKKKKPVPEIKPQAKPVIVAGGPKDVPTEKDREILKDMDRIIWNPDILKKFKGQSTPMAPDGHNKPNERKKANAKKEVGSKPTSSQSPPSGQRQDVKKA
ncbi:MAG TPA: hypothetical protein VJ485_01975 [archaeon]|jgi:hypothetical protein|nr:hypothetical protein [archaeon]